MDFVPVNWDRTGKASMKVDHGFSDGKPWLSYCAILRLRNFTKHVLIIFQGQTDVPIFRKIPILIPPKWCFFFAVFFLKFWFQTLGSNHLMHSRSKRLLEASAPVFRLGFSQFSKTWNDVTWRELSRCPEKNPLDYDDRDLRRHWNDGNWIQGIRRLNGFKLFPAWWRTSKSQKYIT